MVTAEDKHMLATNDNDYPYHEREKKVSEIYNQHKSILDIAKLIYGTDRC
jgi:hypothetical protein